MIIQLDKIELNSRINALGLRTHYLRDHCEELYYDTDLDLFMIHIKQAGEGSKYSGKVIVPAHNVAAAQVSRTSVPKHQPIGTKPELDTPGGQRKKRTEKTAKSAIAEKAAARKLAKLE